MRSVWFLALVTLGCRSVLGFDDPITVTDDASSRISCEVWHPQGFDPCALGTPLPALHLGPGAYIYDTTTSGGTLFDSTRHVVVESKLTLAQPDQSVVAVLSVDALALDAGATISAIGRKPLLVVAWSTITVDGALDADSHLGLIDPVVHTAQTVRFGAGANEACTVNSGAEGNNATSSVGSAGGGGGGLQGAGGAGAKGAAAGPTGGAGGTTVTVPASVIRGGCPGGASGMAGSGAQQPAAQSSQALGGAGGGAIHLVAYTSIAIAGSVTANGAGGAGAPQSSACGGGGGGSGGYLAFEAPAVTIGPGATITANGGGGGGGGGALDFGNEGGDGRSELVAAPGGTASSLGCGKPGGAGSLTAQLGGTNAVDSGTCGGGGGGGGGAGFVLLVGANVTMDDAAKLSPAPLNL